MARISYTEGYSDKSVIKQIWDLKRNKQDALIAGDNITIEDNVISATGGGSGDVTKAYVDQQVATRQPLGDYATRSEVNAGLAGKQPLGDYATKSELTTGLAGKQDIGDYATRSQLAGGLAGKQNVLTAGANITIENDVISATGGSGGGDYYAGTGISINENSRIITNTAIPDVNKAYVDAQIADVEADIPDVSNLATKAEVQAVEAEIPDVSGLATKTELTTGLAGKQNVLTAGANISIVGNVISASMDGGSTVSDVRLRLTDWDYGHADMRLDVEYADQSYNVMGIYTVCNDLSLDSSLQTQTYLPNCYAVRTALSAKQDTLVSGTSIKTINGNSILGSGDLVIGGGGGSYTAGNGIDISNNVISSVIGATDVEITEA